MKFQRIQGNGTATILQVDDGSGWGPVTDEHRAAQPDLIQMLEAHPPRGDRHGGKPLPFQPASYRDFMLFERHFLQAGSGFLRRFRPNVSRLATAYEKLTGRVFPPLKPSPLFYAEPIYYMGNHLQFVSDGASVAWPAYTQALDFELELGFVLARPLLDASPEQALAAIGGFVVFNDISARDIQPNEMNSGFGPQKSKHFANAISAVLVSADEVVPHLLALAGRVRINGQVVAESTSKEMMFGLGEALAHASKGEQLHPGEFFGSGTWPNGAGMENDLWLQRGDEVTIEIDRVGSVSTIIR